LGQPTPETPQLSLTGVPTTPKNQISSYKPNKQPIFSPHFSNRAHWVSNISLFFFTNTFGVFPPQRGPQPLNPKGPLFLTFPFGFYTGNNGAFLNIPLSQTFLSLFGEHFPYLFFVVPLTFFFRKFFQTHFLFFFPFQGPI